MSDDAGVFMAPDHLYTWLDVQQYFTDLGERRLWPDWLLEVDAYWDAVRFVVNAVVSEEEFWRWLTRALGSLTVAADRRVLLLDDAGTERLLPVEVERAAVPPPPPRRHPRWSERRVVAGFTETLPPPATDRLPQDVVVAAFHSFKGGVGRTLHCVATARELARGGTRVLLVDGDLEAPGITWMVSDTLRIDFAFEDFLTLVHGGTDERYEEALGLGRKFLANQELDGVVVLPARRDYARVAPPHIRPDDLLTPTRDPYVLTEVLARLGAAVGAAVVLVDLRAGASELSAPLLLDPRVHRVVVTTISDQAVRGTHQLLKQLARRAPAARPSDPDCTVLVTQFDPYGHRLVVEEVVGRLRPAALEVSHPPSARRAGQESAPVDLDAATPVLLSPFQHSLLSLPADWQGVLYLAENVHLGQQLRPLVTTLRSAAGRAPTTALGTGPASSPGSQGSPADAAGDLDDRRRRLAETASKLVYAEEAPAGGVLATEALSSLVESHRTEVPIEVVIGGKGSGKTFTHVQLWHAGSWSAFADRLGISGVSLPAQTVPVLSSQFLTDSWQTVLRVQLDEVAHQLSGGDSIGVAGVRDLVREHLNEDIDQLRWRRVWLTCLARAVGLPVELETVEDALVAFARDHQVVFALDGLEDLFPDFIDDRRQQVALRALLVDCPDWLRTLRGRPLGLVVFVRRDLARAAVPQNFGQFEQRYKKYALSWDPKEALRLVAWVCHRAQALPVPDESQIMAADEEELSGLLVALWGDKMGSPKSREARSIRWFFAALSDFKGQLQARDIVSFLAEAAEGSINDNRWSDRLLTPAAMRNALGACSRQKIDAISVENPPVGHLLDRLRNLPAEHRKVPFRREDVSLSQAETDLLDTNGVLFRENDQYWIPEIFRHGLGFKATGRPRVVNIADLLRKRDPA